MRERTTQIEDEGDIRGEIMKSKEKCGHHGNCQDNQLPSYPIPEESASGPSVGVRMWLRIISSPILRHFSPDGEMQQKTLPDGSSPIRSQELLDGEEDEESPRPDEVNVHLFHQVALQRTFVVRVFDAH